MNQSVLAAEWDDYLVVLREDAHQLLAWGYADTLTELPNARDEYDITGLLANAMDERIRDPQTPERFMFYAVHNERPISPDGEQGKSRPRLDIQIERCGARPRRYFIFEAKRLRDDATANVTKTMKHYLGDEGVCRFVAGRYAADSIEAAMVGCVQAHDAHFWFERVNEAFAKDAFAAQRIFALVEQLHFERVIADLPDEAISVHRRSGREPLRLFHIFLNCR